ncbi:MAG TPA: aminotransferase class III-fold pyridoxal phosphate-dependent enzyme, partial [Burkholderiaceae bacterium]|nr:aminotransferase class III-fold pyridoxal phosphate-dependent enzyme [Burkholderiaceae bacterium]
VPGLVEVRGEGLMLGIELDRPCGEILTLAMQAGLLLSVTADTVVRLVPPLILTVAEADEIVSILAPIIRRFLGASAGGAESKAA